MKYLIDTRSVQAAIHYGVYGESTAAAVRENYNKSSGLRLSRFLKHIEAVSGELPEPSHGRENELQLAYLNQYDGLVLTTRMYHFSQVELEHIRQFVEGGASLLVMSNHPPFDQRDDKLARLFGFSFKAPMYPWHGGHYGVTTIHEGDLGDHPITQTLANRVIFNNSCRIVINDAANAIVLAKLPEESPPENVFALAIDRPLGAKSGRVVAIADSGFIGGMDTTIPGPGQFEKGDNPVFMRNVISWLCHKL